jgi:hypothetical protein
MRLGHAGRTRAAPSLTCSRRPQIIVLRSRFPPDVAPNPNQATLRAIHRPALMPKSFLKKSFLKSARAHLNLHCARALREGRADQTIAQRYSYQFDNCISHTVVEFKVT